MRVHHLNCISSCPLGGYLMDGRSRGLRGRLSCHCLLLETDNALVLVDTGFGLQDVAHPRPRLDPTFLMLLRPELREEMTAIRQIQLLGFDPRDVRHIVLTHLDFDHAGGLDDFPHAEAHLLAVEHDAAVGQKTLLDRMRYRPAQWSGRNNWQTYSPGEGDPWFGFECVRSLRGVPDDVLLVPLIGHTFGHAGVAVRTGDNWLLLAGDAYFYHGEMNVERPYCTPGLRLYQTLMEKDRSRRLQNQARLRALKAQHGAAVTIASSHDPVEFERMSGRSLRAPAGAHRHAPRAAMPARAREPVTVR